MSKLTERLKCVTPALITPMKRDGSLDEKGMENVVKYVTARGMTTLFILGYCGEGRALSGPQRRRVVEIVRAAAPKDTVIVAGAMADSADLIVNYAEDVREAGADMVLATPTDFFFLTDEELENLFTGLDKRLQLPLMIYNCPENHHYVNPEMMARLAKLPRIQALKQTSTTHKIQDMQLALDPADDFVMLSGDENAFFPALCLGVEGFIVGGPGNFSPAACKAMFDDYKKGEVESVHRRYMHHVAFWKELYGLPYPMAMPQIKAVMEIAGVCERWVHGPVKPVTDADMKAIEALLKRYEIEL